LPERRNALFGAARIQTEQQQPRRDNPGDTCSEAQAAEKEKKNRKPTQKTKHLFPTRPERLDGEHRSFETMPGGRLTRAQERRRAAPATLGGLIDWPWRGGTQRGNDENQKKLFNKNTFWMDDNLF
jgi:hypothetical protein